MRNRLSIILIFIFALIFNWSSISSAAENSVDPRETAIDRAIGGMVEGSRPLEPQGYAGKNQTQRVTGSRLSPSMDTRVTAQAPTQNVAGSNGKGNVAAEAPSTGGPIQPVTQPTTEPTTEPASGGSASDSIVNVDANVDLSGGSPVVDANLAVDTNAGTLLDANTSTTTDVTSTDTTVTESGTFAGQELTTNVNEALVDATLETEIVATDIPTESEATAGLEADVDPVSADSDVTPIDPADGIFTGL